MDIGGGTSNIAVYEKGVLRGTCCLDIGGRLIKVENGRISYIFPKIQALAAANGISLAVGDRAYPEQLYGVCRLMAAQLAQALRLAGRTATTPAFIPTTASLCRSSRPSAR